MGPTATTGKSPMNRIRIGAIGLACVFLLVMLATALLGAAGDGIDNANAAMVANAAEAPSEPLAELGVAPGNGPPEEAKAPAATRTPAVPPRR